MDKHSKAQRSKNMRAVKNKGSKIEDALAKTLFARGLRYRRNVTKVFGKPDIVFTRAKVAVFCDSEFWHGKDFDTTTFKNTANRSFWNQKIRANIERDKTVNARLAEDGWTVLRFWGKEILKNTAACADRVVAALRKSETRTPSLNPPPEKRKEGTSDSACVIRNRS